MKATPRAIQIGGVTYRVHSSAPEGELQKLAEAVDAKLQEINPHNRPATPQMFLLVALAFAYEAGQERERREGIATEAKGLLHRMIEHIDAALESNEESTGGDIDDRVVVAKPLLAKPLAQRSDSADRVYEDWNP